MGILELQPSSEIAEPLHTMKKRHRTRTGAVTRRRKRLPEALIPIRYGAQGAQAFKALLTSVREKADADTEAAETLGVSQPTLSYWLQGQRINWVSFAVYTALEQWIEQKGTDVDRQHWEQAFPPLSKRHVEGYAKWLGGEIRTLAGLLNGEAWGIDRDFIPCPVTGEAARAALCQAYSDLRRQFEGNPELVVFQNWARKRGFTEERIELATIRVLQPLLCHLTSAFVEPDVSDICEATRQTFIKAGVRREKIILQARSPDLERLNAVYTLRLTKRSARHLASKTRRPR